MTFSTFTRMIRNTELADAIQKEPDFKACVADAAGAVAQAAQDAAPVDEGNYRAGIEPSVEEGPGGWQGRVDATYWTSHWVEWGSANNEAHAPLRRGVADAGLTFEEHGK